MPGAAYEFGPAGAQFNEPVSLTIHYDSGAVPAGVPSDFLRLHGETGGTWMRVVDGILDESASTATGEITSFSQYGVRGLDTRTYIDSVTWHSSVDGTVAQRLWRRERLGGQERFVGVDKFDPDSGELLSARLEITSLLQVRTIIHSIAPTHFVKEILRYRVRYVTEQVANGGLEELMGSGFSQDLNFPEKTITLDGTKCLSGIFFWDTLEASQLREFDETWRAADSRVFPRVFLDRGKTVDDEGLHFRALGGWPIDEVVEHSITTNQETLIGDFLLLPIPGGVTIQGLAAAIVLIIENLETKADHPPNGIPQYHDMHASGALVVKMTVTYVYAPN